MLFAIPVLFSYKHMKRYHFIIILTGALLAGFYILNLTNQDQKKYAVGFHIPADQYDTLLVDMVTYMGVKPRYADHISRHEPQHRSFYIKQAANYHIHNYYICNEGYHYYYMIRPARHHQYEQRAIGGRMKLNDDWEIGEFEELFATIPGETDSLKKLAKELFPAMMNETANMFAQYAQWIEWPDERCRYDREKNEWRYDVAD